MIISLIFILLIILGVGLPLVLLIAPEQKHAAILGISYSLGIGIFTFLMFISNIAGLRFSLLNETVLLLFVSAPLILLARQKIKNFFSETAKGIKNLKLPGIEKLMIGVMIFALLTSCLNTFYWPVHIWDSVVLYNFRAQVFATTGFMKDAFVDGYYTNYPLLTSLAHTIVYLTGGKYPQFLHSLFYISLMLCFYGLLREFVSRKISIFFTFLLVVSEPIFYHSTISYTNLAFAVYVSLSTIYLFLWDRKKNVRYLILSAILASLSTWTRFTEPYWFALLIIVFLVSIYRKRFKDIIIYALFLFPIRETWKVYKSIISEQEASVALELSDYIRLFLDSLNVTRLTEVVEYLYTYAIMPWGAAFYMFIFAFFLFLLKRQKKYFMIFFITSSLLGVLLIGTLAFSLMVQYLFTIGDAATRLTVLYFPLFMFCAALVFEEFRKEIIKK